ncbi:MAG: response regulator transcription factor [Spirochaetaceae bacterium]|nr:MAG: response regulator transcription factor [Spirochaetaceae bacterium]
MQPVNEPLVALVEDEQNIREVVGYALKKEGYRVLAYKDGEEAWNAFRQSLPDLVILDIIMPRMDGLELCRRIRSLSETLPLIFLSSKDEEFDRVLGLELGADDYLCKPFSTRELLARVKVLFRRAASNHAGGSGDEGKILRCGPLELDRFRHLVRWNGENVPLTVTEFRILEALVRQPGYAKTREQLLKEGYPYDDYISDRNIDGHIKRIRKKLAQLDLGFDDIETIYGLGYRYRADPGI